MGHNGVAIRLASDRYNSERLIVGLDLKFSGLQDKRKVTMDHKFGVLKEFLLEQLGWVDAGFLDGLNFWLD